MLISAAKKYVPDSNAGQKFLNDVKVAVEKERIRTEDVLILLKGFVKGLYVAEKISFEEEYDFSELMGGLNQSC
jgi:hypothetical protein